MQKGKRGKREKSGGGEWRGLLIGVAMSVGVAVALLGVCAILIGSGIIPEKAGEGGVLISCAFGCLVGGCAAVRGRNQGTLLWGLMSGAATAAVLGVSGFLLYDELAGSRCAAVSVACLCGGGLAGVLGGDKKRRR